MDLATLQEVTKNFEQELIHAIQGKKTSFSFIENTLPRAPLVQNGEIFQVMVIGATVFISATVEKKDGKINIISQKEDLLPLLATKEILFSFLEKYINTEVRYIAINFAWPQTPIFENGRLDGIIARESKEHSLKGLVNKKICAELELFIEQRFHKKIICSGANDTVCLTLAGLTTIGWENLSGGIIGSGLNFALFLDATTIVNLEAGDFNKFPLTPIGKEIIANSVNPKIGTFEKFISGVYLYLHFNLLAKERHIAAPVLQNSKQLSLLAQQHDEIGALAKEVLENSAQLASCAIAGITNGKKSNMTFVMQGSVFWKGYGYKETVAEMVKKLSPDYKVTFVKIENADILGAAKLLA